MTFNVSRTSLLFLPINTLRSDMIRFTLYFASDLDEIWCACRSKSALVLSLILDVVREFPKDKQLFQRLSQTRDAEMSTDSEP